jgi:hypothetical protein
VLSDSVLRARAHGVRLERHIEAARNTRRTFAHAAWILLALTWGVGWPVCQWRALRHAEVASIEPALTRLVDLADLGAAPPPEFMRLDAVPQWRHGLEIMPSSATGGSAKAPSFYVPLTLTGRDSEEVRWVIVGLSPRAPNAPATLKPPYPVRWVAQGVPATVRKEMARRGVRFAEAPPQLVRLIELSEGRVPNHHAFNDRLLLQVVTGAGSALGGAAAVVALLVTWRLRRLRAQR